jgi:hypothetical protein
MVGHKAHMEILKCMVNLKVREHLRVREIYGTRLIVRLFLETLLDIFIFTEI